MTIALGVDAAMEGIAGFAVVDMERVCILYSCIETYALDRTKNLEKSTTRIPKQDDRARAVRFALVLQEIVVRWNPDVVVTELIRTYHGGRRNPVVVASLSISYTAICLVVKKPTPIVAINTGTWQAAILPQGYSKDTKGFSIARVQQYYKCTLTEHQADAVNMCDAHQLVLDNPEVNTNPNCVRVLL
jgi:hypothetical protein